MRREVRWVPATTVDEVLTVALPGVLAGAAAPHGERLPERELAPLAVSGARD